MKVKNAFVALILGAALAPQVASADVTLKDVLFRTKGEDMNIRVVVRNRTNKVQTGPVKITLFLRPNSGAMWQEVKTWDDIAKLEPGQSVARDLFTENVEMLKGASSNNGLEAKATVEAPGVPSDTKTASNTGYQK